MKTMESISAAQESTALSPANDDASDAGQNPVRNLDLSRRRWMRGAAAMAPVVLTLRSGALAAQSLVSVKYVGTLDKPQDILGGGQMSQIAVPEIPPVGSSLPLQGDICVTEEVPLIASERIPGTVHANGRVSVEAKNNGAAKLKYYCSGNGYSKDQRVAILSSASCSSITGCTG